MIDRMILFIAGCVLAILAAPVQGDPLRSVRPDPLRAVKAVPAAKTCPCNCGCADDDCDCVHCQCASCPGTLTYHRDAAGCIHEYRGNTWTGTCWDAQGRKWVNGRLVSKAAAATVCRT